MKYFIPFLTLLLGLLSSSTYAQNTTINWQITIPILTGQDDVEEDVNGGIYVNSTDLELTEDGDVQTVGMHFKNVTISEDATIESAYIQFTTDEVSTGNCNLNIRAEITGNANSFSTQIHNVSDRPTTTANVNWSPADWTSQQSAGVLQRTPDLTPILLELQNQANFTTGNAINFIITGTGRRTAHAYEGNPNLAARLVINMSIEVTTGNLENVFINELMAANDIIFDNYGEADDWLELYNSNDYAVSIEGIYLSDEAANLTKWQVTEPLFIPAGGFKNFWLDDNPEQGANHVPFKLSSAGETVFISQMQGTELVILDSISFENLPSNISYGRLTDGAENWVLFGEISPEFSNNGNALYLDASIDFSPAGGFYQNSFPVTMTASDPSTDIRYTTDGSKPTANSPLYTSPISISATTNLRAAPFKSGFISNIDKNEFYLLNTSHELPIVQVSIHPDFLFDEQEGIYVEGDNGILGYCAEEPKNWNQDWTRPASVAYFNPEGEQEFRLDADMKIGGGCSRAFSMKGMNFFFRDGNKIEYKLFEQSEIDEFKRFKIRASGNDFIKTMIRDAAIQAMLYDQVDIDLMAYEPVVVYLNGDYWGVYGMREFYSKHYIESHHGVDKDNVDYMKNPYYFPDVKEGDAIAWNELSNYINSNDLSNTEQYNWVADRIDINEYINYNLAQIYVANYDWPANNVALWRDRDGGKFRWMLFDLDLSSGYGEWTPAWADYDAISHATNDSGESWPNGAQSTLLLRKLLQNQDFQQEFTQRSCTFAQTIFTPERSAHFIDSLKNRIQSEIPALINKFNNAPNNWQHWNSDPVGGSIGLWNNAIADFKDFFEERLDFSLENFENKFDYAGHYNLTLNFDENTNGTVVLHKNEMKVPYNYTGAYFENIPLQVKAIPKPGYHFVRWEETGVTARTINFVANQTSTLTPIFAEGEVTSTESFDPRKSTLEAFPIPAHDNLFVQFQSAEKEDFTLRLFDVLGQLIFKQELQAESNLQDYLISVQHLSRGVYFLEAQINGQRLRKKVILE